MDPADLENRFTYHPPKGPGQVQLFADMREAALRYAQTIDAVAPDSREKSLAITHLEEVVFWTNAAIARHG